MADKDGPRLPPLDLSGVFGGVRSAAGRAEAAMERVLALAATREGGELAVALVEVMKTIKGWQDFADPQKTIRVDHAAREVQDAIQRGLAGG